MRFTPRRRAVIAILVTWPLAFFYFYLGAYVALDLLDYYRAGAARCTGSWRGYLNGCTSFSPLLAWVELLVMTSAAAGIAYLLARWIMQPVRDVAQTIGRFGPNSLGLRLRSDGPRDEMRQLSDEIDTMLDRLAEGYEAQRRFASSASHELRTPLATQRALIEVSLSTALTPDQLELVSRQLLATNERNEKLIDGLLTLAETERGLQARSTLRLDAIVASVVELLRPSAKEREVELHVALQPAVVTGEEALLDRLAHNLVGNAIKYNHPGGEVSVEVLADRTLVVRNSGPEVRAEQVPGLFEPFGRLGGERLAHGGGVGLGLTIARSIVAAHGGSIDAYPNPGGGLVVQVRLPS